ncbi:DgyrCDS4483 [Dimorphilus gyrociliatus]|uniref:DgyrCDS4483 n=1 Tax=Dimorphilus gyrociliatus TaxID=2664684 RepID=A0A7I8VH68_9ANNE|nr:DgyrCDS4483 [Dimorphilus gyrociliatus]
MNHIRNFQDNQAVKSIIESEITILRSQIAEKWGKYRVCEAVNAGILKELERRRTDMKQAESDCTLFEEELNRLKSEFIVRETKKENLLAENQGLKALVKVAKEDLDKCLKDGSSTSLNHVSLKSSIGDRIARELPEDTAIYSQITREILGKSKRRLDKILEL